MSNTNCSFSSERPRSKEQFVLLVVSAEYVICVADSVARFVGTDRSSTLLKCWPITDRARNTLKVSLTVESTGTRKRLRKHYRRLVCKTQTQTPVERQTERKEVVNKTLLHIFSYRASFTEQDWDGQSQTKTSTRTLHDRLAGTVFVTSWHPVLQLICWGQVQLLRRVVLLRTVETGFLPGIGCSFCEDKHMPGTRPTGTRKVFSLPWLSVAATKCGALLAESGSWGAWNAVACTLLMCCHQLGDPSRNIFNLVLCL